MRKAKGGDFVAGTIGSDCTGWAALAEGKVQLEAAVGEVAKGEVRDKLTLIEEQAHTPPPHPHRSSAPLARAQHRTLARTPARTLALALARATTIHAARALARLPSHALSFALSRRVARAAGEEVPPRPSTLDRGG